MQQQEPTVLDLLETVLNDWIAGTRPTAAIVTFLGNRIAREKTNGAQAAQPIAQAAVEPAAQA